MHMFQIFTLLYGYCNLNLAIQLMASPAVLWQRARPRCALSVRL